MGSINPFIDPAVDISNQVTNNYQQGIAYSYNEETGTLPIDWLGRPLEPQAFPDLQAALAQDWFSIGFVDFDFSASNYINFDGWNQPNIPYLEISYAPVPVELISFTADVNENNITLNWSTATETNNQGFDVERFVESLKWEKIGFVQGSGTTTELRSYSFVDENVTEGKYSYRLKQIDFDGSFEYSDVVEIEVGTPNQYSLEQNYPNPFNPTTRISYSIKEKGLVTLRVFDILGNEVRTLVNEEQDAGNYKVEFSATSFASGIYFYSLQSGEFLSTKKMILLK